MAATTESQPPYVQVTHHLRERIRNGEFPVGTQLPSGRRLADEYEVAPNTIASALRILRDEGIVVSQQGRGSYVREVPKPTPQSEDFTEVMQTLTGLQDAVRQIAARLDALEDAQRTRQDAPPAP